MSDARPTTTSAAGIASSPTTVRATLEAGVARHPDVLLHLVGRHGETSVSLAQLWDDGQRLAALLRDLGAGPGDVIASQISTWREGAVAFVAAVALDAVPLPLVGLHAPADVAWILGDATAAFFVVARTSPADVVEELCRHAAEEPTVRATIVLERTDAGVRGEVVGRPSGVSTSGPRVAPDRALLLYTSGTESRPKGVWHTHDSVLAEVRGERPCGHSITDDEVVLFTGPLGHVGSAMYLVYPYAHGLPVVYLDRWEATAAAAAISRHRVTFTHGPPTVVLRLAEIADRDPAVLASLRRIRIGGAEVEPELITRLDRQLGVITFRTYGSTEHPTTASGTEDDPPEKRAATDGRPLPGNEIRIVGHDGEDRAAGEEGEIWTRGGERFDGYQDARLDEAALVDGWYRTGDLGMLDADGYLVVTGRIKDVIVRGGENIPSRRVVDTLLRHPAVTEAAVVPVKDTLFGERAFAFVVTDGDVVLTIDDLRDHFRAQGVARQYVPEGLEHVPELPRNAMGKVRRDVLRDRANVLGPAPSAPDPTRT